MNRLLYKPVICLMGPTGVGKTAVAIELVKRLPCTIVSVDSAMVYRGMDIGTAKPAAPILVAAPHRLLDICDPSEIYSAGRFRQDVVREITEIQAQSKIPLLVGGTMLYFRALQQGLSELPSADADLRQSILVDAEQLGWSALHKRLQQLDPQSAQRIHAHDAQRIQRALEIYYSSGQTPTAFYQEQQHAKPPYAFLNLILLPAQRALLHQQIAQRFQQMLQAGFVDEVNTLYQRGDLTADLPSMRAVGYRQLWQYLAGMYNYEEMQERAIAATRQLAKRQLTWLRTWPNSQHFFNDQAALVDILVKAITAWLHEQSNQDI